MAVQTLHRFAEGRRDDKVRVVAHEQVGAELAVDGPWGLAQHLVVAGAAQGKGGGALHDIFRGGGCAGSVLEMSLGEVVVRLCL